ncbi:serine/threonine protein kinase [Haloactinospora alba]|uniref:Serine/threonine protein kinase n=1 Tax=Haloactinospora alba TaxID=405555 RepID=A0A543NG76_9ACTN|nr:protein kinase [Haloactinospora alba]TQN30852.1 serine/threonine protein kinase [Haloactinospora alba]
MTVPSSAGSPDGEELPERVGRYLIRRRIGQGGMGVVYQAEDPHHDRPVAIKVLKSEVAGDEVARARLAREVETMRRVHSHNVAEVIDADTQAELPWVVTEYVPGPTLDSTVTDHGPLRGRALTRFVSGLARAIRDIHAVDVIHRDLKPGNVIISNGEPIVIDFGIAHAVDGAKLTQTGTFVGTPSYLSPEVIEGTDLGPATDVHAWGATVAFAATGNAPYGAGSFEVIFFRILNGEISLDGMPDGLQPLVRAAVSRDMGDRPNADRLVAETERLNLDLPLPEELSDYRQTGVTGKHTIHGATPGSSSEGSGAGAAAPAAAGAAAGAETAEAADRSGASAGGTGQEEDAGTTMVAGSGGLDQTTRVAGAGEASDPGGGEAERTMVAGSGGADQTMRVPADDPQSTGLLGGAGDERHAPGFGNDPAEPRGHYYDSTLRPEDFRDVLPPVDEQGSSRSARQDPDDSQEQGSGLFGMFRRSSGDRISDYFGNSEGGAYAYDEPRQLPWLLLLPALGILAGISLLLPTIGLVIGLVLASFLGALDTVKSEHARRVQARGPRSSDTMVVVLSMPWAVLRTLGRALLFGLGYLAVGIVIGLIFGLVLGDNSANYVGSYALFLVVVLSFVGPNGAGARRQALQLTERIGIRNVYVYWGVIVAVVLLAMLILSWGFGGFAPRWDPMSGPSDWF